MDKTARGATEWKKEHLHYDVDEEVFILSSRGLGRKTLPRECLPNLNDTTLRYIPITVADGVRVMSRLSEGR